MPLKVEIVTPDKVAWHSAEVDSIVVPTRNGEIEILPGHIPLVSMLEAGSAVVKIKGREEALAIDVGYMRCIGDTVSILTEDAIDVRSIDFSSVEKARKAAEDALSRAENGRSINQVEQDRLEAVARFAIAQKLTRERFMKK